MKFLVDINVGKLTRLLRMLGYDALLFRGDDDGDMIAQAFTQGRIILTKDQHILSRRIVKDSGIKVLHIKSLDPDEQLREVALAFGLNTSASFTRCLDCNGNLNPFPREGVEGLVPPYVYQTQREFKRCSSCGKVYWKGTHWQRMKRRIRRLES